MGKYVTRPVGDQLVDNGTMGPVSVEDMENGPRVQVTGTFGSGSAQVQISLDGSAFFNFGTALTADGLMDTALPKCKSVQVVLTGATTPTVDAAVGGEDVDRLG
jgi:hypothetical protein